MQKLRNLRLISAGLLALFLFSSCASIISKSSYPVSFDTTPSGAKIVIKDHHGVPIYHGNSPAVVPLKAGAGFFQKASYSVEISSRGYETQLFPITTSVDGWYFGNILFGGFIGLLIVDPATGAMFKIDQEYISVNLKNSSGFSTKTDQLKIYDINEVPKEWKEHLVAVKPGS